jgi:hypothetical protein
MKLQFKLEDFEDVGISYSLCGFYTKAEIDKYQEFVTKIANVKLNEMLKPITDIINEQAKDEGLWSVPAYGTQSISEAYLQQELRRLHKAIEKDETP